MGSGVRFGYTGLRVENIEGAVDFFTRVLGMRLRSRVEATWNKGVFVNLEYVGEDHYLELNWYAPDSPYYTKFVGGDQLDHLGIKVKDFDGTLEKLRKAGYPITMGPFHEGKWHVAFVKGYEGIWLDIYKTDESRKRKKKRPP